MKPLLNRAVLLLGSNIAPRQNLPAIQQTLRQRYHIVNTSDTYETLPVGGEGSNYLNLAVEIDCSDNLMSLRANLKMIEVQLGRVRTSDKNAPRTADIDVILFNGNIVDKKLLEQAFIAVPVAQISPDLPVPSADKNLASLSIRLASDIWIQKVG
jgi:2-amino-4-hydroxy-6-hydroxymethyldihydropteridine diphosphokinase